MVHEDLYRELTSKIKQYHPSNDLSIVEKAYITACDAHSNQFRESGEAYIIHPLSAAIILAEIEMDLETIAAGILHDIIEDTDYTYKDISVMFSEEIAQIIDGVTKLDKIEYTSKEEEQAENYRKMFLSMSKDIRVILVKIADRLHNLRTLKHMTPAHQKKKAQETLDIYAPLAHRLGISRLRYEMEDLSFKYLNPDAYYDLAEKISRKQDDRLSLVHEIVEEIKAKLAEAQIDATVEGRPKHFFSIYKKMVGQDKTLDQIYDLFAVRAIVNDIRSCYEVLGVVHEMYKPVPGRFKDYIAMPKSNRYQSLHTTLIGPEGEPFELQIRTWEMHRTSEYGIAAHWKYKQGKGGDVNPDSEEAKLSWLRQILEWQRDLSDNKDFLDAIKFEMNIFKDHVYCFTPKGEVISLLNGSTPIDFAYAIHSAIGNKMIGARVNNKMVTIDYVLQTGDRAEIITSGNSRGPSLDWLKVVKTSQARSKINQWFKQQNKEENILRGKELLDKEAKKKNMVLSELLSEERLKIILNKYGFLDWDSLCAAVGHGGVKEGQVINRLNEEYQKELDKDKPPVVYTPIDEPETVEKHYKKNSGIVVKGVGDINVRFSKCCSPVPGDEIVGFVTRGRGVSLHRTDCINIINLDETDRQRLIEAEWQLAEKPGDSAHYRAEIRIVCDDNMNLFNEFTKIFSEEKIHIKTMNAKSSNSEAVFNVGMEITGRTQLDKVCAKLLKVSGVHDIERVTV